MRKRHPGHVNAMIQRKLADILRLETKDPRFQRLTITRVESSSDRSFASVYFAIYPPEDIEGLTKSLNHAAGFFSHTLGRSLNTRNTPKLVFVYDEGFDHTSKIEAILRSVGASSAGQRPVTTEAENLEEPTDD